MKQGRPWIITVEVGDGFTRGVLHCSFYFCVRSFYSRKFWVLFFSWYLRTRF